MLGRDGLFFALWVDETLLKKCTAFCLALQETLGGSQSSLSCSQVVDLGNLVIERLLKEAIRFGVAFDSSQAFHSLDVSCNILVLCEELIVC